MLPIVEIFGPTIQGEGPASGRISSFIRFGGCNLACSWCDSSYTWDAKNFNLHEEISLMTPADILSNLPTTNICVITGGEPMLYQKRSEFLEVLHGLVSRRQKIHIETNGTIFPTSDVLNLVDTFVVSPKLAHADARKGRVSPILSRGWKDISHNLVDAHLKLVVKSKSDVQESLRMAEVNNWDMNKVWIMPEGVDIDTLQNRWSYICDWAVEYGLNVSNRLHVLAWGDKRGC